MDEYKRIYTKARLNSASREIEFSLTWEDMQELVVKANGCCIISGIPFDFTRLEGLRRRPFGASLDRINSKKGYTKENCRLVCCAVNFALNEWGEEVFKYIANKVANGHTDQPPPYLSPSQAPRRVSQYEVWHRAALKEMKEKYKVTGIPTAKWKESYRNDLSPHVAVERVYREAIEKLYRESIYN